MTASHRLSLAIVLCAAVAATGAEAAVKRQIVGPVARGCTQQITPICFKVASNGQSYALVGAVPTIPAGVGVDVWGTPIGPSPCGTVLRVTSWRQNRFHCSR